MALTFDSNGDVQSLDTKRFESEVVPKLVQPDTDLVYEPNVVTRLGGTLPFDTNSEQLQCGETVTDNNGDMNMRLNMVSIASKDDFAILQQMRSNGATIKLISVAYSGPATFDEMKFDRIPDANGSITIDGTERGPFYKVQLQTKENDKSKGLFG